jgi:hypothetical protein
MSRLDMIRHMMLTARTPAAVEEAEAKAKAYLEEHPEHKLDLRWGFERLAMTRAFDDPVRSTRSSD